MSQPTTTAELFRKIAPPATRSATTLSTDYLPAWSYITIVQKNIETQTMLVTQHPMF